MDRVGLLRLSVQYLIQCLHQVSMILSLFLSPQSILKKSVTMLHTPSAVYHYNDTGGGTVHHNKVNAIFQAAKKDLLQVIQIQVTYKLHLLSVMCSSKVIFILFACKTAYHQKLTSLKYSILIWTEWKKQNLPKQFIDPPKVNLSGTATGKYSNNLWNIICYKNNNIFSFNYNFHVFRTPIFWRGGWIFARSKPVLLWPTRETRSVCRVNTVATKLNAYIYLLTNNRKVLQLRVAQLLLNSTSILRVFNPLLLNYIIYSYNVNIGWNCLQPHADLHHLHCDRFSDVESKNLIF